MSANVAAAKQIFLQAVENHEPERWQEFLQDACGTDTVLRERVEALLVAYRQPNRILDSSSHQATLELRSITEEPGTVIGPYKLLEQIGEGGFGVVFLAEQATPIRRRVALKIVKPGMDTRQVLARFEAERQALALMDHPGIAKVFDAGVTELGRSYFVMELVAGVPINEYCDECNLPMRERLELFIAVCQAVQHAHQKGIIHRDLKPTNILVAMQDGRPVPKIIDFGVAKAIDQQLTEHTLMTAYAQIVGTPLFMSPEQAELSPLGVDTRSDIYSLGVLLYELLSGMTPFNKDRLHAASYDELRRIIREEEPLRPSARISTLAADVATTVAGHRRTEPHRLRQSIRGELDWIVMKCLEKDRNRRYESAGSLARDVEHFLQDEPVQACPPSQTYRMVKFMRRNKAATLAGAAVFIILIVTSGISTWLLVREQDARREAEFAAQIADAINPYVANSPQASEQSIFALRPLLEEMDVDNQSRLYFALADIRGRQGRWKESAAMFGKSIELQPNLTIFEPWHYYLPALVQSKDLNGYHRARQELLRRFGSTTDPRIAECVVKDCLITPWNDANFDALIQLSDTAIQAEDHWAISYFQFGRALLEYRRANYEAAQKHLQLAEPGFDTLFAIEISMLQAMLHHRLGDEARARAALAAGSEFASTTMRPESRLFLERLWNDWVIAHALMNEATKLINPMDSPTEDPPNSIEPDDA